MNGGYVLAISDWSTIHMIDGSKTPPYIVDGEVLITEYSVNPFWVSYVCYSCPCIVSQETIESGAK